MGNIKHTKLLRIERFIQVFRIFVLTMFKVLISINNNAVNHSLLSYKSVQLAAFRDTINKALNCDVNFFF